MNNEKTINSVEMEHKPNINHEAETVDSDYVTEDSGHVTEDSGHVTENSTPQKRGRGRPPKPAHLLKPKIEPPALSNSTGKSRGRPKLYKVNESEEKVKINKRSVGRPRKNPIHLDAESDAEERMSEKSEESIEMLIGKPDVNDKYLAVGESGGGTGNSPTQKKGRGRPPLPKHLLKINRLKSKIKRPRGRPRKESVPSDSEDSDAEEQMPGKLDEESFVKPKKPRGRPRKSAIISEEKTEGKVKRSVGRPRKPISYSEDVDIIQLDSDSEEEMSEKESPVPVKRPRGRPPKSPLASLEKLMEKEKVRRSVGRPRKHHYHSGSDVDDMLEDSDSEEQKSHISEEESSFTPKRRRGRPSKSSANNTEEGTNVKLKKRRGRPPKSEKKYASPSNNVPSTRRLGRPAGSSTKYECRCSRWPLPTLTESIHTMPDPDNTILRLTGRHFPDVLEQETSLCQVCLNNSKEIETAFCCSDCSGSPPLCAYPCFGIYHTVFRYWQTDISNDPLPTSRSLEG